MVGRFIFSYRFREIDKWFDTFPASSTYIKIRIFYFLFAMREIHSEMKQSRFEGSRAVWGFFISEFYNPPNFKITKVNAFLIFESSRL